MKTIRIVTFVKVVAIAFAAGICVVLYARQPATRPSMMTGSSEHREKLPSVTVVEQVESPARPLLTIFTTFKEVGIIPHHQLAFNIVVSNWPSFKPLVRPVMFLNSSNSSMAQTGLMSGWDIIPVARVNEAGTPFLRDMYQTVFDRYDSWLYGYANGDLIFDDGFVKTLRVVVDQLPVLGNNVLLTGIRTNVDVDLSRQVSAEEFQRDQLKELAKHHGKLFHNGAVDYFFVTKNS